MNKIKFRFLLSCLLFLAARGLNSQIIEKETIHENVYEVTFSLTIPSYSLEKKDGADKIKFPEYLDESKQGEFILPVKDLLIPVPPDSKPEAILKVIESENIRAYPEINPEVKKVKDGSLKYTELNYPEKFFHYPLYEVKGFLWIEDNYCLHLKIYQVEFDPQQRLTRVNTKFNLVLTFQNQIPSITDNRKRLLKGDSLLFKNKFLNHYKYTPNYQLNSDDSWIDYTKEYIKIGTSRDAVYRIYPNDFTILGVDKQNINPKTFRLILKGFEIPIFVLGEDDLSFDSLDYIEFAGERNMGGNHRMESNFGKPYNEYLDRYSDSTIYWLTWGGNNGLRVQTSNGSGVFSSDTLNYYNEVIHKERDNYFDFSMADLVRRETPFWLENKTWVDGQLGVGTLAVNFELTDVYPDKTTKFFYKLQDFASDIVSNAHLLGLSVNSNPTVYDSVYIDKYQQKVLQAEVNSNILISGNNNLLVHSYPTQATINACATDWAETEYPRYLIAINDSLNFKFPFLTNISIRTIHINNINIPSVIIWKYRNIYERFEVSAGNNQIFLTDTIGGEDSFVLIDPQRISSPKFFYKKQFINLRSSNNSAEYLAVTHKKFLNQTQSYVDFISNEYGISTKIIDIDDIYDEFAYGFFNPEAIKDFLMATHNYWQSPKPSYICLIGSATYDYYGNKTKYFGAPPVYNYVPSFGAPVSDNWFVTWDTTGAYFPRMNVGRLPFAENEEFDNYFQKHLSYVNNNYDDWNKRYLFFSGGRGDNQHEIDSLKSVNQFVIDNYVIPLPIGGLVHHFYKTINPNTNFGPFSPSEIEEAIDNGAIFISYIGHSGTQTWDNSITDPFQLSNERNRYSLITDFGCSTAKFAEPDVISFSQTFINSDRGQAITYIGNSSLGFTSTAVKFPKLFYKKILADSVYTISEAHKQAKLELIQNYGSGSVNNLFTLTNTFIGDPIITLPVPSKPNLFISNADVITSPLIPREDIDSLNVNVIFFNYGKVINDTISIHIEDKIQSDENYSLTINRVLPLFKDSIALSIPIYKKPGNHSLSINLDFDNRIDEINETDNSVQIEYNVSSSSVRPYLSYLTENTLDSTIYFINPSTKPLQEIIETELSDNENFISGTIKEIPLDTFYTKYSIQNLPFNKRYWIRFRLKENSQYDVRSFKLFDGGGFVLDDSLSFSGGEKIDVSLVGNKVLLDTSQIMFGVLSAGFNDGNSAVISKNSQNLIPENTLRGHHVCFFQDATYEFAGYRLFDLLGDPNATGNYMSFLDSLDNNYLIMIAISDEGSVSSHELRDKLKEFGSIFIDSVAFRGSRAFIGKRGSTPGTVPEAYSNPFDGRVIIDTTIASIADSGYYSTIKIGPSQKWINAEINKVEDFNSSIKHLFIGIKANGSEDSLGYFISQNNFIDLNSIDPQVYPYLNIISEFHSSQYGISPELNSIRVKYKNVPEIGTNYQAVTISSDSVLIGADVSLNFNVYNVGETSAVNFNVQVEVIYPDNSRELIYDIMVDTLNPSSKKYFIANFNTLGGAGDRLFNIKIDSGNRILELFEDNNFYQIPFYVKADTSTPSINITFDGVDILDGDYISANPEIKIELFDQSLLPVNDTSSITLFLNDEEIYFANNPQLSYQFNSSNPKMIVRYKPQLQTGEYSLKVFAMNTAGTVADSSGVQKYFIVNEEIEILNVYNYPNPSSGETYFTFKLTQIPDELKIKIYTIAGRLIKVIKKTFSELEYDFNTIFWDGKDDDKNQIANGVYFYKVIISKNGKNQDVTQKLAIVR